MNNLDQVTTLNNTYFGMRHGHSVANTVNVIVSHANNGLNGYGLSNKGVREVNESIAASEFLDANAIVISSDFRRARESAEIVYQSLGCETEIQYDTRLRERNFGRLELTADIAYRSVWERDRKDPEHEDQGVESTVSVMHRTTELILDLERREFRKSILLVSHGDALQILQTAFQRENPSMHRALPHFETAEIRLLQLQP